MDSKIKDRINKSRTRIQRYNHSIAHLEKIELEIMAIKQSITEDTLLEIEQICSARNGDSKKGGKR